jgi:LppX_LprAFG lipoprotein
VAAGCAATAALILGGCSAAHQSHHAAGQGHSGGQGHAGGQGQVAAGQAIALAAKSAAKLTSLTVVESMTMHGFPLPSGGGLVPGAGGGTPTSGSMTMHANASVRLKPALLASIAMNMNLAGKSVVLDEILTSRAIYLKIPGILPTPAGKPWAKISLASLPNGTSLQKLFNQAQNGNPLTAMGNPAGLAKFLAAAKHLRVIQNQSVNGVATTEYSGLVNLASLVPSVPAAERHAFGSLGPATITFWIDHQHQMRKMVMRFAFGKASIAVTVNVTSINKPVRITPPPASQVSAISHP